MINIDVRLNIHDLIKVIDGSENDVLNVLTFLVMKKL